MDVQVALQRAGDVSEGENAVLIKGVETAFAVELNAGQCAIPFYGYALSGHGISFLAVVVLRVAVYKGQ